MRYQKWNIKKIKSLNARTTIRIIKAITLEITSTAETIEVVAVTVADKILVGVWIDAMRSFFLICLAFCGVVNNAVV